MKQFINFLFWIALYFVRLPIERIQIVRSYRQAASSSNPGWLYPWLLPERRFLHVHVVGERRQPLRPVHLLPVVLLAEFMLVWAIVMFMPRQALIYGFIGNLVIIGLAMLPVLQNKNANL